MSERNFKEQLIESLKDEAAENIAFIVFLTHSTQNFVKWKIYLC